MTITLSAGAEGTDHDPYAGYEYLQLALTAALDQAARGKGKDRHASDAQPFHEQPLLTITQLVGIGFPLGQAMKKVQEAGRMADRGQHIPAQNELLGAIVYLAAAWIALGGER